MKEKISDLELFFKNNQGRLIHKYLHYFDVYERHFKQFRDKDITVLEIGVSHGGSLQMWRNYFGEKAKIYGIDIDPRCKDLEEEGIKIFIGSQADRKFLRSIKEQIPKVDILIDDGGHTMKQQIVTFQEMFDHVKDEGVYLCEDLHTSYWLRFGGGFKRRGTFIEYSKNFIDYLNAYHSRQNALKVNDLTRSINSIHYYDSIIVLEKKRREEPIVEKTGNPSFDQTPSDRSLGEKIRARVSSKVLFVINKVLQVLRLPGFIWR